MRPRRFVLAALIAALPLAATACGGSQHHDGGAVAIVSSGGATDAGPYAGMEPPQPLAVGALSLPDVAHGGAPLAFAPPDGHLLLVFFGFANCTDVCPTTMADLRAAIRRLPEADRGRVQVAFATVDPARDTPERLAAYVRTFFPDGAALRTEDDAALRRVATAFSAAYEVTGSGDATEVTHSALVYAVGPDGRVLVMWPDGTPVADVADDLAAMLAAIDAGS